MRHHFRHHNAPETALADMRGGVEETEAQSHVTSLPATTRHPLEESGGLEVPSSNLGAPTEFASPSGGSPSPLSSPLRVDDDELDTRTRWEVWEAQDERSAYRLP